MFIAAKYSRGVWKSTLIFWAVIVGTLVYLFLFPMSPLPPNDLSLVATFWQGLQPSFVFDSGIFISFLICYLALSVNDLGSIQAVDELLKPEEYCRNQSFLCEMSALDIDFVKHQGIGLYEWLNPNTPNAVSTLGTFSLDYFKNASSYILKHRKWIESHIDNYSPYAFDGSGDLLNIGMKVKSGLWYPFCFHRQGFYCLIFSQVDFRRTWREKELEFIASVAQGIMP